MEYTLEQCVTEHEEWLGKVNGHMDEIEKATDPDLKQKLIVSLHKRLLVDFELLVSTNSKGWTDEEIEKHVAYNQLVAYTLAAFEVYYMASVGSSLE